MYVRGKTTTGPPYGAKRFVIRGAGFGSILASLFKKFLPTVISVGKRALSSNIAKTAAASGAEALANVAVDALKSKSVANSTKKNLHRAKGKVLDAVESTIQSKKADMAGEKRLQNAKRKKEVESFKTRKPSTKRRKVRGKFVPDKDDVTQNSESYFNENRRLNDIFD